MGYSSVGIRRKLGIDSKLFNLIKKHYGVGDEMLLCKEVFKRDGKDFNNDEDLFEYLKSKFRK